MIRWTATFAPALLALVPAGATRAAESAEPVRWSAAEVECPDGTEPRSTEIPEAGLTARWCQVSHGGRFALHGPYLELFPDGSVARQGWYRRGVQAGRWVAWTPAGEIESDREIRPGEAGRHVPRPEDLCPPGTIRDRSRGHSDRSRMWSKCTTKNEAGERVLEGPYVTWDEERAPGGGLRYVLRRIMTYRGGERHGPHLAFEGPFGREAKVEEETFHRGSPKGLSRAFYFDGTPRELRHYRDGRFHGERVGYHPDGSIRWRIVYEDGRPVETEGDLTVGGQPCEEPTVPTTSADGREEFCARRYLHFSERQGAYLVRDEAGRIVERGRYERDEKAELWQAPPGVELPPEVPESQMVALIELLLGGRSYAELSSPLLAEEAAEAPGAASSIPFHIWFRDTRSKKYPHPRTVVRSGVVEVYGLAPGSYYMRVEVDANPANERQWPGDLTSSSTFEVPAGVLEGEITNDEARLVYTLRLLEPWDNDEPLPVHPCSGGEAALPTSLRFAWLPPAGEDPAGIEYHYRLTRRSCEVRRKPEPVAAGSTFETVLALELPPSRHGEYYEWSLAAKRAGLAIGQLMTFGVDHSHGWSLGFRVE